MKPSEFITEADNNIAKKKAEKYLDSLTDKDLETVLSVLQNSLNEAAQDLMAQKKAGKRIDGRPSDFIAYDDVNQTAKRYLETNNGLEITDVRYSPPPRGYAAPTQSAPVAQPEVKSFVASLDNKEKEALLNVVKKEAKKRKAEPKKAEPKKSSSGKVIAGVLAGLLALGIFMPPNDSDKTNTTAASSSANQSQTVTDKDAWGKFELGGVTYEMTKYKYLNKENKNIKIYISKRTSPKSEKPNVPTYTIYAVDVETGKGVGIDPSFRTDFDTDRESAEKQFSKEIPITDKRYELVPNSSQYNNYITIKDLVKKFDPNERKKKAREETINYYTSKAGTVWDMGKIGYSRARMVETLGSYDETNKAIINLYWSFGNNTDDYYTRNEFQSIVRQALEQNLKK